MCTSGDADQERECEVARRRWANEVEDRKRDEHGERGVDGAHEGLIERAACRLCKILFAIPLLVDAQIFTRPVEDDDGVMDGKAEHRKNGRHEQRIYLRSMKMSECREKSDWY